MRIGEISTERFELEVYECNCGFHIGIDSSYLEQVEDTVQIECPACGRPITVPK